MDSLENFKGKHVLFFSPKFFGYQEVISEKIESYGGKVSWFDERSSNSSISKAIIRTNPTLIKKKIKKYYDNIWQEIKDQEFDFVFFIAPETVQDSFLQKIKEKFSSAIFILYIWDSFKNKKRTPKLLPYFDRVFTFDHRDSKNHGLNFRPLFFIDTYKKKNNKRKSEKYALSIVGTLHSDRYVVSKKISNILQKKELLFFSYFYTQSPLFFWARKVFIKNFFPIKQQEVSYETMSALAVRRQLENSVAILDIEHPNQRGLTLRVFESLALGKKIITTNKDIKVYDFYNEDNILIIDRANPRIDFSFFDRKFQAYPSDLLRKYSLEGWLSDLFIESRNSFLKET